MAKKFKLQEKDKNEFFEKGENKMRHPVLGKEIVEGDFYHCYQVPLGGESKFNDVWYCRDAIKFVNIRNSINPQYDFDWGPIIFDDNYYYPLTIEEVDEFTVWMTRNGDKAGIKAWNKYKEKIIKEAEMAKKNDAEKRKEINLYDPKFVHFEWDESLEGKVGFYGSNIDQIRCLVNHEGTYPSQKGEIRHNKHGDSHIYSACVYPFESSDGIDWQFFYYDPHYEVKWAYFKEDKPVQMRRGSIDSWEDIYPWGKSVAVRGPEYFDDVYQYRIKPEEKQKPNIEVNVDVKVSGLPNEKVEVTINGKKCVFENAEQAKKVLFDGE